MTISTKTFEYADGDTNCVGYLAWDESIVRAKPGILVNHAWSGRDDFAESVAVQMAANGYVGIALDNYGAGARPETVDDKMALMGPLKEDRAALLKRLTAGYKAAAALDMVDETAMAAIGFCFGGLCTLDMAARVSILKLRSLIMACWMRRISKVAKSLPISSPVMAGTIQWHRLTMLLLLARRWSQRVATGP